MHCSRVFRSSAPSDLLPSSPSGRPSGTAQGECGSTRSMEWGVGPGGGVPHRRVLSGREIARQAHPGRHVAGAGPLSGEGRTMRDPELVARAQRAATRLESAWEQWRALHGLAVAPGQPVVSYVGYSLKEPWGEPRVVIGIDADEAEYLAEFLDRDECAQRGQQVPPQQAQLPQVSAPAGPASVGSAAVRSASAGQADRISVGRHRRISEFGTSGRARTFRPRPPASGSGPRPGRLDLG